MEKPVPFIEMLPHDLFHICLQSPKPDAVAPQNRAGGIFILIFTTTVPLTKMVYLFSTGLRTWEAIP